MALPFKQFESYWRNKEDHDVLASIVAASHSMIYVNEVLNKPNPKNLGKREVAIALQDRNEYMVNSSYYTIGMYIPDKPGGTLNCIRYIMSWHKPFCLINPDTLAISAYKWDLEKSTYQISTLTKDNTIINI
jgi:uncharacterized phage-like protein YoqJ